MSVYKLQPKSPLRLVKGGRNGEFLVYQGHRVPAHCCISRDCPLDRPFEAEKGEKEKKTSVEEDKKTCQEEETCQKEEKEVVFTGGVAGI